MIKALQLHKNKKGFTLIEVIVVLVILAILAAILIPTLTGYIDKANEKAVLAEARSAVMAANTICSEHYANAANPAPTAANVAALAELTAANIEVTADDGGYISELVYTNYGLSITYTKASVSAPGSFAAPVEE